MPQLKRMLGADNQPLFEMRRWGYLAVLLCLMAACTPSELRPVPIGLPAGGSPAVPPAPAAPMAPPVMAYSEDPEAETEEWEDYIWADNEAQARQICQQLAEQFTQQGGSLVTYISVRRVSQRGSRWACKFKG